MAKQDDSRLFDARNVERNIQRGVITRKDYEKHLKSLPDVASKATHMGDIEGQE